MHYGTKRTSFVNRPEGADALQVDRPFASGESTGLHALAGINRKPTVLQKPMRTKSPPDSQSLPAQIVRPLPLLIGPSNLQ